MRSNAVINFFKQVSNLTMHQVRHKMKHLSLSFFKDSMIKGGVALLVITIVWEIIEDVIFPAMFWALGKWVHPAFYAGIPVSWILCLHWIAVPLIWGLWMKRYGRAADQEHDAGSSQ